jgi:ArsR family transcriptional regulator, cadmium/lead-responsive transcriptional repressor
MLLAVPAALESDLRLQNRLLHGLADPSRLMILAALRGEERRVSDLVEDTGLSQPNVSKHLGCLWECGLVAREKRGREVHYRLIHGVPELLAAVDTVIDEAGETIGACPLTDLVVGT